MRSSRAPRSARAVSFGRDRSPRRKHPSRTSSTAGAARAHSSRSETEKPYDDVFFMGFSSGAYFVSSLALRGRAKFDGFATFAGGAGGQAAPDVAFKAPVYVGVCADDVQTAGHSRAFGSALAARGWPNRVDEQKVGHMFSDIHVAHAVAYLRSAKKSRPGKVSRATSFSSRTPTSSTTARSTLWEVGTRKLGRTDANAKRGRLLEQALDEPLRVGLEQVVGLSEAFLHDKVGDHAVVDCITPKVTLRQRTDRQRQLDVDQDLLRDVSLRTRRAHVGAKADRVEPSVYSVTMRPFFG